VRLPVFLLRWLVALAWKLGWTSISEAPPGYIDYALYPWCVSNVKLKTELLFMFKYDALRAFSDYLDSRTEPDGTPRVRSDAIVDVARRRPRRPGGGRRGPRGGGRKERRSPPRPRLSSTWPPP